MDASRMVALLVLLSVNLVAGLTPKELRLFHMDVELREDGGVYSFFSSGYPPHDIDHSISDTKASVQNYTYNITISPDNNGDQLWCTTLGPVGFAKNGVALYNALTGAGTDSVYYEEFDECKGHTSPGGAYHYHQFSPCIGDLLIGDEFIGIAIDGNPIYGPNATDYPQLLTSADLDACHGRFKDGRYRYHITTDFPYVIGCYKAEPAVNKASSRFHQYPDRSDGDKPDGDQPGGDRPGEDRPSGDRPSGGGSGGGGRGSGGGRPGGEGGERPGGGGRQRRQTKGGREMEPATCTNSEFGAELCDCSIGTMTQCDTLEGIEFDQCNGAKLKSIPDIGLFTATVVMTFLLHCFLYH